MTKTASWELLVSRADLATTRLVGRVPPALEHGQVRLRVDRVGVTANNVTYAVLGDSFHYWDCFPTAPGWGLVPLWGFAEVEESRVQGVAEGQRLYGYLPPAGHLAVRPERIDDRGFKDCAPHRSVLPSPYNTYRSIESDPAYEADREDLQVLYRPLFWTSYLFADWVVDNDGLGAQAIVVSSASSKTAYGAAFMLQGSGLEVVGLTSARNVAFTEGLGCYDRVVSYDARDELPLVPSLYADLAGNPELRRALRQHLGDKLVSAVVVGLTQQFGEAARAMPQPGDKRTFFTPNQMDKSLRDWGKDTLDQRFADAWKRFAPVVEDWVDVDVQNGPQALEQIWLDMYQGRVEPRVGHVVVL